MAWAPDYITGEDQGDWLRITDSVDDVEIALAVTAASRAVDNLCNRQFGSSSGAQTRSYPATPRRDRGVWVVEIDDLMVGPTVALDGDAITDYTLEPVNAAADGMPWTRLVISADSSVQPSSTLYTVDITANPWGWTAIPDVVQLATRLQASRFLVRRDSPYGVAGSPDQGNEMRLLARLDPDVAVMLPGKYRRPRKVG
jgi:hypothetical protein